MPNTAWLWQRWPDLRVVQHQIAESRPGIEQVRCPCHQAARTIDMEGNKAGRHLVATAKIAAPRVATAVIDRTIQVHGGAGMGDDTLLAAMYGWDGQCASLTGPRRSTLGCWHRPNSVGHCYYRSPKRGGAWDSGYPRHVERESPRARRGTSAIAEQLFSPVPIS